MKIVYAKETPPESITKSIFLAGPTPRSSEVSSWRPEALRLLEEAGYDGVVFVPEDRSGIYGSRIDQDNAQIKWEDRCLHMADCILFWIPRELQTMPALTTNTEWGRWENSGKVVFGAPQDAEKVSYQRYYAEKLQVPIASTLRETVAFTLEHLGEGALRTAGEREVPLHIWRTPYFTQWYAAQTQAGNRLDGARVEWTFRVGPKRDTIFLWALHVNVYIASEDRNKTNEVMVARPDIAATVMYRRGETIDDTEIVLIHEFRSPAVTEDGFVWDLPSGSSFELIGDMLTVAVSECSEETGLVIEPSRLQLHAPRQLIGAFSAHKAHLFSVEITERELDYLRSQQGTPHGAEHDSSERTYVEVVKLKDIRRENKVDWSMLGMILSVLAE